jgi:tetrahydromethanopterin S-methyltransferase subunit B
MMKNKAIDERIAALEAQTPDAEIERLSSIRCALADEAYGEALIWAYQLDQIGEEASGLNRVEVEENYSREVSKMGELITALEAILDELDAEISPEICARLNSEDKRKAVHAYMAGKDSPEWQLVIDSMKEII